MGEKGDDGRLFDLIFALVAFIAFILMFVLG
jgi:hypothetical protein